MSKASPEATGKFVVLFGTEKVVEFTDGPFKGARCLCNTVNLKDLWAFERISGLEASLIFFFKKAFRSWNLVTASGAPMPTVGSKPNPLNPDEQIEYVEAADYAEYPILNAIMMGWYNKCTSTPDPLETPSPAGKLSLVDTTPTE